MTFKSHFDELNRLQKSLQNLDERGLVLSLAAFAGDSLATLLKAYMLDNVATKKLVDGFDAPLGTFSSRIRAAYALGLITKGQYNDLEHLRSIRNMFSHTWESISFLDGKVSRHIAALNYSNVIERYPESPRDKLEDSISFLLVEISSIENQIKEKAQRPPPLGSRLYAGAPGSVENQIALCREKCDQIRIELLTAKAEKKTFLKHLQLCWVERYFRAIANSPKEKTDELLQRLTVYAEQESIDLLKLHRRDSWQSF